MRRALAAGGAVLLALAGPSCRHDVSLGAPPEAGPPDRPDGGEPSVCAAAPDRAIVAPLGAADGILRALAVKDGVMVAAFDRANGVSALALAWPEEHGFHELGVIGKGPSAVAIDGTYAYAACADDGEVHRIQITDPRNHAFVQGERGAASVVSVGKRAVWSRPLDDRLVAFDFASAAPTTIATFPRATSLAVRDDDAIVIAGDHVVGLFEGGAAAPRKLADRCSGGVIAAVGDSVLCVDEGGLVRVDPSGAVVPLAPRVAFARDVVAARGRAFVRTTTGAGKLAITAVPLDGIGGPAIVETFGAGPSAVATDGCGLYFVADNAIVRRNL